MSTCLHKGEYPIFVTLLSDSQINKHARKL